MHQFIIEGGHPISGTIKAGGNKNAAIKMLPACLLTDEPVILNNMPNIGDVETTIQILEHLGVDVTWTDTNTLRVHAKDVRSTTIDPNISPENSRQHCLCRTDAGALWSGEPGCPGGDSIGERRLDTHVFALQKLGATVEYQNDTLFMHTTGLKVADVLLTEASVTATENAIIASVTAKGTTTIHNAASEPHIQNLCDMLTKMGAQIDGVGTNRLIIQGVDKLHGGRSPRRG